MSDTLRYGLLGSGMMGQEHIRNINLIEGCEVVALCDTDADMLQRAVELAPAATTTSSLDTLLDMDHLDALVISTPNFLHAEHLKTIVSRRSLPLLVEKPLVTRHEDRALIRSLQNDYKAPIWVAMEYRYMPPMQTFLSEMEAATGGVRVRSLGCLGSGTAAGGCGD